MAYLTSDSEFVQETGDVNHEHFIILSNRGNNEASLIIESLDVNGNPVSFPPDKFYSIDVSNDAYDQPRENDKWSYYNVIVKEENWIHLKDVPLGTGTNCTNSWRERNTGNEASILHFKYVRFWVDPIPDIKIRMTCSSR